MLITDTLPDESRAKLVFGLEWRAYSKGRKIKGRRIQFGERKRYAAAFAASHYVEMDVGETANGGFCTLDADDLKGARLYSGAARVAALDSVKSKPAVMVLLADTERSRACLIYVMDGIVQSDEVLQPEKLDERIAEITMQAAKEGVTPVMMVSAEYARAGHTPFDPHSLLDLKKVGLIKSVPNGIPGSVVTVAAIGLVGLGIKLIASSMSSPVVVDANQGQSWKEQYATAVQTTFSGPVPQARLLASQMLAAFDHYESNRTGFQFNNSMCRVPGPCVITYDRMGGSFEEFGKAADASLFPITFARDGRSLTARGPAIPKVEAVDPKKAKSWPTEQQLTEMLQTPAQRMATAPNDLKGFGYNVQLSDSLPILATRQPSNEPHVAVIRQGNWEITGYRWQSELLDALPPNMRLESLKVSLDLNAPAEMGGVGIKFDVKGKYYVVQ